MVWLYACTLWRLGSAALNPKTFYKSNTLGDRKKMPKFFEAPTPAPTVRMQKHRHCYCKIVHCPRPCPTLLAVCSAACIARAYAYQCLASSLRLVRRISAPLLGGWG